MMVEARDWSSACWGGRWTFYRGLLILCHHPGANAAHVIGTTIPGATVYRPVDLEIRYGEDIPEDWR